mmetsp:Transcript_11440/g.24397  ORF Transcript_11440/g.24397 Transcript_11440/m.24397 type:complete len:483 (-) Transcript_11440:356-1804(-)
MRQKKNKMSSHSINSTRILWLLIGLALGVSFANLAVGNRHLLSTQQIRRESPEKTTERHRRKATGRLHRKATNSHVVNSNNHKTPKVQILRNHGVKTEHNHRISHLDIGNTDNDNQQVYDGELITQMLKGEKPFPESSNNANNNEHALRLKYKPGTLHMTHAEALQHCFVNTTHYAGHITDRPASLVSLSEHYKLIYRNIPKSSSSSARHAMKDFLEGEDYRLKHDDMEVKVHEQGYSMITFVREPLNRFYSSYDEAYFRMGPWMGGGSIVRDKPRVRQAYLRNKYRVDKYPYLYEGLKSIEDFRPMYCPADVLENGHFLDCNQYQSIDDGTLSHRFEQFVRDYSGLDPFDIHLNMQMGNLVFPTGEPFPVTAIYNATLAESGWQKVAKERGVTIPDGEMTHGRKITRRFNVSKVSRETNRKICKILALDYCCLNIELPAECRGGLEQDGDDDALYCSMERRNAETMKYALEPLVIHPWSDP